MGDQADSEEEAKERLAILFLRSLLLPHSAYQDIDDATLRQFLRARSLNVGKAHRFLLNHLKWKQEFMPEGFIPASDVHNELRKDKFFLQGVDKCDCPIVVFLANRHYGSDRDLEEWKKFAVYVIGKALLSLPAGQEKFVVIADLSGFSYRNMDLQGSLAVLKILQDHYPERLRKCYSVNAPYLFWGFWKMIQPFMDPAVKEKIVFVEDKQVKSTLLKDIDESQLADIFEGKLPLKSIK